MKKDFINISLASSFYCMHYVAIAETLKKLSKKEKQKEFNKHDKIFKKDNPNYDSYRFARQVGVIEKVNVQISK